MLLATIVVCSSGMILSACSEYDNPVQKPVYSADEIVGEWSMTYDYSGTISNYIGKDTQAQPQTAYTRVMDFYHFLADGTGVWNRYYFNDDSEQPFADLGGGSGGLGAFSYQFESNGSVQLQLTNVNQALEGTESYYAPQTRQLIYSDGKLQAEGVEAQLLTLEKVDAGLQLVLAEWHRGLHGGAGLFGSYNINSQTVKWGPQGEVVEAFTADNWQEHNDIFIYVQDGGDNTIYDVDNNVPLYGYEHHRLPWAPGANESPNLPENIWKDVWNNGVKEGNPWRLAIMQIGENTVKNGNFLAFYNQYTGVLRFFFYVHESITSNGSTHWWGLQMSDKLASRSVFGYPAPMDRDITTNEAKAALNQPNFMGQLVSPWVANNFNGSSVPLQAGWWAYDLDLSVYRGNEATVANSSDRDNALLMNLFAKGNMQVELASLFDGTMDGSLNLEATYANSEKGKTSELADFVGKAKDIGMGVKDVVAAALSKDVVGSLKGIVALGKKGATMAGVMEEEKDPNQLTGMKGTINMSMKGKMDTKGLISSNSGISGFAGMVMKRDNFMFDNLTGFGEGVWNLEQAPVVYYTNAYVGWHSYDDTSMWFDIYFRENYSDKWSPFGGQVFYNKNSVNTLGKEPQVGYVCYFDPSSIKLQLNPNLFTPEEIANAKVYAICGVRKDAKFGSTAAYRAAQKLHSGKLVVSDPYRYFNRPFTEAPFDALSNYDDKQGMQAATKFGVETYEGRQVGVFGRGDATYLIEPQALFGDNKTTGEVAGYMPAYEVDVVVVVEHNGNPIVYNRTYLPEYKSIHLKDMPEMDANDIAASKPANYVASIYEKQMEHVQEIWKWSRRTVTPYAGTYPVGYVRELFGDGVYRDEKDDIKEVYPQLFDGDVTTKWCSSVYCRDDSEGKGLERYNAVTPGDLRKVWWAECFTRFPVSPTGFKLTTCKDTNVFPGRNPIHIAVFARPEISGFWKRIDNHNKNLNLPAQNLQTLSYQLSEPENAKNMQFFRIEVLAIADYDEDHMQLAEFEFTYD